MKNIFSSEFNFGQNQERLWKFTYDAESGAWSLYPIEDSGLYEGVCLNFFDAKKMAKELVRLNDLNAQTGCEGHAV